MSIELDIEVGDILLGGKFKNKRIKVKSIGMNELGQPTINGKPLLNFRIEKLLPKEKQSKETREAIDEAVFSSHNHEYVEKMNTLSKNDYNN